MLVSVNHFQTSLTFEGKARRPPLDKGPALPPNIRPRVKVANSTSSSSTSPTGFNVKNLYFGVNMSLLA